MWVTRGVGFDHHVFTRILTLLCCAWMDTFWIAIGASAEAGHYLFRFLSSLVDVIKMPIAPTDKCPAAPTIVGW